MIFVLIQTLNPSKGQLAAPYNSLRGTGPAFGWVVVAVFLFLTLGTLKAYRDDKKKREWRGRVIKMTGKKKVETSTFRP